MQAVKKFNSTLRGLLLLLMLILLNGCGSIRLGSQLRQLEALPVKQNNNTLLLVVNDHLLGLTANSQAAMVDKIPVQLAAKVTQDEKKFWQLDEFSAVNILRPVLQNRQADFKVILIDPGHGGKDSGAVSASGVLEKDLNLQLALTLASGLRKHGFTVHLTREDDRFLSLDERPALIDRYKADLFISIHHNSAANKSAAGHEVFVINAKDDRQAQLLGKSVYTAFRIESELGRLARARGVKLAGFKVLRLASVPAVLLEAGFVSNDAEAEKLASPEYQNQIAAAVIQALLR